MGVWIETVGTLFLCRCPVVTPCMGVWIETAFAWLHCLYYSVTPCMGVWIETLKVGTAESNTGSHPVWVCGLKLPVAGRIGGLGESHPVWVCGLKPVTADSGYGSLESHPVWVCGLKLPNEKATWYQQ